MYKIKNDFSPSMMKTIFPSQSVCYNLRYRNHSLSANVKTVRYGTDTISFRGPKTWQLVPDDIKSSKSLEEFKNKIKNWLPKGCDCKLCKRYVPKLGYI